MDRLLDTAALIKISHTARGSLDDIREIQWRLERAWRAACKSEAMDSFENEGVRRLFEIKLTARLLKELLSEASPVIEQARKAEIKMRAECNAEELFTENFTNGESSELNNQGGKSYMALGAQRFADFVDFLIEAGKTLPWMCQAMNIKCETYWISEEDRAERNKAFLEKILVFDTSTHQGLSKKIWEESLLARDFIEIKQTANLPQ